MTTRIKKIIFILTILGVLTSCNSNPINSTQISPIDSSSATNDVAVKQMASVNPTSTPVEIPETHLHDTTTVSGNFILFLRPDSLRFQSYTLDDHSGIYETDSDFGFGITSTQDSLPKYKKYKNIQAVVSTNRYIIIKDCKSCPLTIDRDTIDYGIILSGKGREIKSTYEFVHSGDYLQEINEYFKIK